MCIFAAFLGRSIVVASLFYGVAVFAGADQGALATEELPSAVDLYSSYIEYNGGRTNLKELKTLVASGTVDLVGGESYAFKMTRKQPDKFRLKMESVGHTTETISNGKQAWTVVSRVNGEETVVEIVGEELLEVQADSSMDGPFLKLAGRYGAIRPVAFEDVRGHAAIRVEIDPSAGVPYHTIWLSAEHFQEVKMAVSSVSADGAELIETEIYFADFEKLIGIYHAKKIDYVINGEPVKSMRIDRIRPNVGIFDSYFSRH
jgi:hypothetical protein